MDVFCHINELGLDGWTGLRSLVLAFSRVVLWAPSASYMNKARESDPTIPTPDELLWYVRNDHIKIMARDWWLDKSPRRLNHPWEPARDWIDSFDGEIRSMWIDDQRAGRYGGDARVTVFEDVADPACAQAFAAAYGVDLGGLSNHVSDLPGYVEKAARAGAGSAGGISILQDARNHGAAFAQSGASRNLGTPMDEGLMHVLHDAAKAGFPLRQSMYNTSLDVDKVMGAVSGMIRTIQEAGHPCQNQEQAFDRTRKLIRDAKVLTEFRNWITTCDQVATSVHEDFLAQELSAALADEIEERSHPIAVRDFFLPRDSIGVARAIGGAGLAAAAVALGTSLAPFSVSLLAVTPATAGLRKLGWIPEQYDGPRWPFYFAEGTKSVKRKSREKMLTALRS